MTLLERPVSSLCTVTNRIPRIDVLGTFLNLSMIGSSTGHGRLMLAWDKRVTEGDTDICLFVMNSCRVKTQFLPVSLPL